MQQRCASSPPIGSDYDAPLLLSTVDLDLVIRVARRLDSRTILRINVAAREGRAAAGTGHL